MRSLTLKSQGLSFSSKQTAALLRWKFWINATCSSFPLCSSTACMCEVLGRTGPSVPVDLQSAIRAATRGIMCVFSRCGFSVAWRGPWSKTIWTRDWSVLVLVCGRTRNPSDVCMIFWERDRSRGKYLLGLLMPFLCDQHEDVWSRSEYVPLDFLDYGISIPVE